MRSMSTLVGLAALCAVGSAQAQPVPGVKSADQSFIVSDSPVKQPGTRGSNGQLPAGAQTPNAKNPAPGASCPLPSQTRVRDVVVRSTAVGLDLNVRIILPTGWTTNTTQTWPVLYLLGGHGNSHEAWTCATKAYDFLQNAGVIVVMPEAMWFYDRARNDYYPDDTQDGLPTWYSDWSQPNVTYRNKSFSVKAQTFHTQELRELIKLGYHGDDAKTAVAGLSMGGFGALHYAALEPSRYVAAAAYSAPGDSSYASVTFGGVSFSGAPEIIRGSIDLKLGPANADRLWGAINGPVWNANNPKQLALQGRLNAIGLYVSAGEGGGTGPQGIDFDIIGFNAGEAAAYLAQRSLLQAVTNPALRYQWLPDVGHTWPNWNASLCRSLKKTLFDKLGVAASVRDALTCPTQPAGTP
jgi:diacylglycerol O-acyltransferase/trehalose O-mycolyltransferase